MDYRDMTGPELIDNYLMMNAGTVTLTVGETYTGSFVGYKVIEGPLEMVATPDLDYPHTDAETAARTITEPLPTPVPILRKLKNITSIVSGTIEIVLP